MMFFKSSALAKIRVGSKQGRVHWTSTAKRLQSASLSVGTRQSNRRPGDGAAQPTGPRRDKPGTGVSSPGLSTDTQQACSPSPLLQTKSALTVSVLSHVKMITLFPTRSQMPTGWACPVVTQVGQVRLRSTHAGLLRLPWVKFRGCRSTQDPYFSQAP